MILSVFFASEHLLAKYFICHRSSNLRIHEHNCYEIIYHHMHLMPSLFQALVALPKGTAAGILDQDRTGRTDRLAVIVRLLQLYDECGIYTNFEESRELNGNGIIDWQRTIDTQTPVLPHGRPIYLDVWTRKTRRDEADLVTRLHRAILTECSRFLEDCGLAGLLGIDGVELTGETPSNFGDPDVLDWRLEREWAAQFVTWKQEAIDLMRAYLAGGGIAVAGGDTLRLGTTSYCYAWELACKAVFDDLLGTRLRDLPINLCGGWRGRGDETLLQIILFPGRYGSAQLAMATLLLAAMSTR